MVINQGDVFWAQMPAPAGSEPGYRRPVVVIQNNLFNHSKIRTVVVCALTSNLKLAGAPGNVLLAKGDAGLPKRSVVNVSQIATLEKATLVEKIGTLPRERLAQILEGLLVVLGPAEADSP